MVSVCLPSDALLKHLSSYLGFSYLGHGVSLYGCSSKAQSLLLTLDEGYLLTAAVPDLQRGIAPLGPPVPAQPPLLGMLLPAAALLGMLLPAAGFGLGRGWLLPAAAPGLRCFLYLRVISLQVILGGILLWLCARNYAFHGQNPGLKTASPRVSGH